MIATFNVSNEGTFTMIIQRQFNIKGKELHYWISQTILTVARGEKSLPDYLRRRLIGRDK